MAFDVKNLALSALSPIKLTYSYNSEEQLKSDIRVLDSGLTYYKQNILTDCSDGAFSQQTAVVLTDVKDIKTIFQKTSEEKDITSIACSFYLSVSDNDYLTGDVIVTNDEKSFYVGGKNQRSLFNVIPLEPGIVELKLNDKYIATKENYPYDLIILDEPLQENVQRQKFEIDFYKNRIAFKNKTIEGYRYLSYGIDRKLRFVGVQLNDTIVNEYLFTPVFITSSSVLYNFDPTSKEVRYYNETSSTSLDKTLTVKEQISANTSLLINCSLNDIITKNNVGVNIAITKTNFTTSGTFNTSL